MYNRDTSSEERVISWVNKWHMPQLSLPYVGNSHFLPTEELPASARMAWLSLSSSCCPCSLWLGVSLVLLPLPVVAPAPSPAYAEWLFCANAASPASPALLWAQKHKYWCPSSVTAPLAPWEMLYVMQVIHRFPRDEWESNQPQINVTKGKKLNIWMISNWTANE